MDGRIVKAKNKESGTLGATLTAAETSTITLTPVPENAPGIIVMRPDTAFEEHILYKERDAGAGTVSGLVRDYTNLNGGSGREHVNGASWETRQTSQYINNIVDALKEGFLQEIQTVAYASSSTFTVRGDQTAIYTKGRRVRLGQDSTKIGYVLSSSYSAPNTTVTVEGVTVANPTTIAEYEIVPKNSTGTAKHFYAEDTGAADAYAVALKPTLSAYFAGLMITFNADNENTGTSTLNVDSLGTKTIKKNHDQNLAAGDIEAGSMVTVIYDGTNFQLLSKESRRYTSISILVVAGDTDVTTGDGKFYFTIPAELDGALITAVHARAVTAGTTGTMDIQLHNVTDAQDILSTKLTVDSTETGSDTAATPAVINPSYDDVSTNDLIRVDIDAVPTTKPKGLILRIQFAR